MADPIEGFLQLNNCLLGAVLKRRRLGVGMGAGELGSRVKLSEGELLELERSPFQASASNVIAVARALGSEATEDVLLVYQYVQRMTPVIRGSISENPESQGLAINRSIEASISILDVLARDDRSLFARFTGGSGDQS